MNDAARASRRRNRRSMVGIEMLEQRQLLVASLSIDDAFVVESEVGQVNLQFTVNRSGSDQLSDISFSYNTLDQSPAAGAATAGSDYTPTSGTATIPGGVSSTTISVPVLGDTEIEGDEQLFVNLTGITNVGVSASSFGIPTNFSTGANPRSVTIGDLNNDGKPDLAIANLDSNTVSVLLNTTPPGAITPSYTAKTDFATGGGPISVAIADLNGDGRPDLATANLTSSTVSVLLNNTASGATAPTYATKVDFGAGAGPFSVAIGDLNGDGKPDLALADYASNKVSILLNTMAPGATNPTFSPIAELTTGASPRSVAIGDLNGDGKPDLATANVDSNTVSVLFNMTAAGAGTPTFAGKTDFASGTGPFFVKIGDLNGDGKLDLAIAAAGSGSVSVLLNQTAPGAVTPIYTAKTDFPTGTGPLSVAIADLDGDGKNDLAIANVDSNSVSVLINKTAPGATIPNYGPKIDIASGLGPQSVAIADLNSDGKLDLAYTNRYSANVSVLLRQSAVISGNQAIGTIVQNRAPVADAGGTYVVNLGEGVTLNGSGSSDPNVAYGDTIVSFFWDLDNDGQYDDASGALVSLSAAQVQALGTGNHSIRLLVTDSFGKSNSDATVLNIFDNRPLPAFSIMPNPAAPGQVIMFNPSATTHGRPDRSITSYRWDFGDSSSTVTTTSPAVVYHAYPAFGNFSVSLTATDDNVPPKSATTTTTVQVVLGNAAPVANAGGPYFIDIGSDLTLDASLSFDPNASYGDSIVSFAWDLNNDSTYDVVTSNVVTTVNWPTLIALGLAYPSEGNIVGLKVFDSLGLADTDTTTLTINENRTLSVAIDGSGNLTITDSDSKNNSLTASLSGTDLVITDANALFVSAPAGGALSSDGKTLRMPFSIVTGSIIINTLGGDDSLTIDFSGGNFAVPITFNGGSQASTPGDSLKLTGGTFATSTFAFTNDSDGTIDLSGNSLITYTGLEPIVDELNVGDRVFSYLGGAQTITVSDPIAADGMTLIDSTLGESVYFSNPTNSLTINAGSGDDTVTISSVDSGYNVDLTINGGTGDDTINLNADITFASGKNLDVDLQNDDATPGVDAIHVGRNTNLVLQGTGSAILTTSRSVSLGFSASITTVDGDLTILANQQAIPTSGDFAGIAIDGGGVIQASGIGVVTVQGKGGDSSAGGQFGVEILSYGLIAGGTSGTLTVIGTGGVGTGIENSGVKLTSFAKISSNGSDVHVTGVGGGTGGSFGNAGVQLLGLPTITAGGSGAVTVLGFGGNLNGTGGSNAGVSLTGLNPEITSSGGNVYVNGTGGGGDSGYNNNGVLVYGQIKAGSNGTVTVVGQGGNLTGTAAGTGSQNSGVYIGGLISSQGGNVSVTGTGGGGSGTLVAENNFGVYLRGKGQITAEGSGSAIVTGHGGNLAGAGGRNIGVNISGSTPSIASITSSGGDVSVSGTGGGAGSGANNVGVSVGDLSGGALISAGGSGKVIVTGQGGDLNGNGIGNVGVKVEGSNTSITSSGGDVSVTGIEGGGTTSYAIRGASSGTITTATYGGKLTLIGDSMNFRDTATVSSAANSSVTLRPRTIGVAIGLGAATKPIGGPLNLSNSEFGRISAGTLYIGDSNSGAITVSAPIDLTNSSKLEITTGGDITQNFVGTAVSGAPLILNGDLAPALSGTGTFTVDADVAFDATASYEVNLNGTANYDQLVVDGDSRTIELGGAELVITLDTVPAVGSQQVFRIVDSTGSGSTVSGTLKYAGVTLNDGDIFTVGSTILRISYNASGWEGDILLTEAGNAPPLVSADSTAISASEGSELANSGSFSDAQGNNTVTISASLGSVTQNDVAGTWSWSLAADDGPFAPATVTITATDDVGVTATATFTYAIDNKNPTANLGSSGVTYGQIVTLAFSGQHDDSTADTLAGFHYAYSNTSDFTGVSYTSGSSPSALQSYPGLNAGSYTFYARIIDKDDSYSQYSTDVTVTKATSSVTATGGSFTYDGTTHEGGSATVSGAGLVTGSAVLTYSGDQINAGSYTVIATYAGDANHFGNSDSATITIDKANQTITWSNPSAINYGTALSGAQLNATVSGVSGGSAPGALIYSPSAGTIPLAGTQSLLVTAAATFNYNSATKTVYLIVNSYVSEGFQQPISFNRAFKQGSTIPIKWEVNDPNGNSVTSLSAITSLTVTGPNGTTTLHTSNSESDLKYSDGQYQYNWKTKGFAMGAYTIEAQLVDGSTITQTILLSTNGSAAGLVIDGVNGTPAVGALLAGDLTLYVDNANGAFSGDHLARIWDAVTGISELVSPFGTNIFVVDGSIGLDANIVLGIGTSSVLGGWADGILGVATASGQITIIQGWDWYAGADANAIGVGQYDLQTVIAHEIGHSLGLGHSVDNKSTMSPELATGITRREMMRADLNTAEEGDGGPGAHAEAIVAAGHISRIESQSQSLPQTNPIGVERIAIPRIASTHPEDTVLHAVIRDWNSISILNDGIASVTSGTRSSVIYGRVNNYGKLIHSFSNEVRTQSSENIDRVFAESATDQENSRDSLFAEVAEQLVNEFCRGAS